jgi:hypothetical protein
MQEILNLKFIKNSHAIFKFIFLAAPFLVKKNKDFRKRCCKKKK